MAEKVDVLVDGGEASPGPPLGPALGPLKVNIIEVVNEINEKTKNFKGMKVPVKITVEKDRTYRIDVGKPPTTALILEEMGVDKGTGAVREEETGDISLDKIIKVARMKEEDLLGNELKFKVKEVLGTCISMGVTVEGEHPRDVQRAISRGEHDERFK